MFSSSRFLVFGIRYENKVITYFCYQGNPRVFQLSCCRCKLVGGGTGQHFDWHLGWSMSYSVPWMLHSKYKQEVAGEGRSSLLAAVLEGSCSCPCSYSCSCGLCIWLGFTVLSVSTLWPSLLGACLQQPSNALHHSSIIIILLNLFLFKLMNLSSFSLPSIWGRKGKRARNCLLF